MFYDSLYLCLNRLRWLPCVYPKRRLLLCWNAILNFSFMLGFQCALLYSGSFVHNYGCFDFVINHCMRGAQTQPPIVLRIALCDQERINASCCQLSEPSHTLTSFPLSHLHGMQHRVLGMPHQVCTRWLSSQSALGDLQHRSGSFCFLTLFKVTLCEGLEATTLH